MILLRRRLLFWLVLAYLKKRGRLILLYFGFGLLFFFILRFLLEGAFLSLQPAKTEYIGVVGSYTTEELPLHILNKISRGLTSVSGDGTAAPDVAQSWEIKNDGKEYIFYLKKDVKFSDGKKLTSEDVKYNFTDVSVERPDEYTIVYKLKDSYSPFLITVSKPIFKKRLVGISDYKVDQLILNGNFVQSLKISSKNNEEIVYHFYPTVKASKIAFALGEVSKIINLPDISILDTSFESFKNVYIDKKVDYSRLVTLFYNTKDSLVSSKTLRESFSYTIPDTFEEGERSFGPFPPFSFATQNGIEIRRQDMEHARLLLEKGVDEGEIPDDFTIKLSTLQKYKKTADVIAESWKKLGINAEIEEVEKVPEEFQVFLGEFNLPQDVDQYVLWHSDQPTNITHYENLRVDKLLEDGRKDVNIEGRKRIYADFQKFILADPPASFLFFPFMYDVTRK